jgi:hypothetical protein
MSEHPSRFMLERHCVGDLSPAERDETILHLQRCPSCQVRIGDIKEQAARDLARYPADEFVTQLSLRMGHEVRRVSQFRRWAAVGMAAAMAAAATLILAPRAHEPLDVIALRGSGLQVHRNRDGMAKLMENGDRIKAGDALRVVVTLPHPEPVDVWFVDATGRVDRLLATGAVSVGTGEQALPGSAVVDAPCTDMWVVVGVGAAATSNAEPALKQLGAGTRAGNDDWVPKGCLARQLRCE